MHRRVATVQGPDADAAARAIRDLPPVELCEVRLDSFWTGVPDPDAATDLLLVLLDAGEARGVPLLATLRPRRQCGAWDGDEKVRLDLLVGAAKAGFAWVDLEHDLADPSPWLRALRDAGANVVISDHGLPRPPARDEGLRRLVAMQDRAVALEKLAFPTSAFPDTLRALELAHAHGARNGRPAIAPLGASAQVRALLRLAGNKATYGHAPGSPPAAGQPGLADVQAVWDHWGIQDPTDRTDGASAGSATGGPGASSHAPWHAVLGLPTAHSLSPRIHNAAFGRHGAPTNFGALDVPDSPGAFRLLCTVAPRIGLAGASVTHPHKHHAHDVAQRDETATAVGAVNCLRFTAQGPEGTNTDAVAFRRLFQARRDKVRHIGVLGAGGAARAALWAAEDLDMEASVWTRAPSGKATAEAFGAAWAPWQDRTAGRPDAWVQATTIRDQAALPAEVLAHQPEVIELVYADGPTPLETAARAAGCPVVSGQDFLIEQALDAYRFWTGRGADRAAMEAALRPAPALQEAS